MCQGYQVFQLCAWQPSQFLLKGSSKGNGKVSNRNTLRKRKWKSGKKDSSLYDFTHMKYLKLEGLMETGHQQLPQAKDRGTEQLQMGIWEIWGHANVLKCDFSGLDNYTYLIKVTEL